ncbi:protein kinase domain-containing protein [Arthrospira platensis]|uniref:non-specific serine/threonine protein kinase n=1 Tax=Limnospira platensis NIES-46 TaxID=1236695 RepID=A0A5M3T3B2_LIMPL|nr:protein kinase [Arthrospira platensis]AMW27897.1 serine/threonine protein kinase [Arthrospira platensis YZ]MBD2710998.1 protein kinase [Arthrospira platensis FACHB-835]MDT9183211.1 protein kinase [Limnospira sp. PMC 289.06]MDT9295960.1 protein kinase [Arthrospira platensis PCC 7345]QQW30666.1 protein kinase [Arthrospira sp. PCC 9108]BAI89590.1 serine/threonine protein kinase [Arthrospira platensis NIES-39]
MQTPLNNQHQLINSRYQVIKSLGTGSFGEVFLAQDTQMPLQQNYVIKQLKRQVQRQFNNIVKERFRQEAATLQTLGEHHQIPRLYAYFEELNKFYLVQEYIEGETLEAKVQREGKLSESAVRAILTSLLGVLQYIHDKQIVHRDIKPDNIILRQEDGKPVLIDFGAVKEAMSTQLNTQGNAVNSIVIGTPGFMASEQAIGRPVYSSDLYSLGLTAIYLLTGKLPQDLAIDPGTAEILWRQDAPEVSGGLANVLDKAVRTRAGDRYSSAAEMLKSLTNTQMQPNNIPASVPQPTSTPTSPKRGLLVLSTIVSIVVLGLGWRSLPYLWKPKVQAQSLTIGSLSNPKYNTDLVDYLRQELIPSNFIDFFLGKKVDLAIDGDHNLPYQEAKDRIAKKEWDVVFTLSPIISVAAQDNSYTFAALMFPERPPYYYSALYVRADSPIQSINDITPSTVIALGGFNSASSFYMPVYDLYGKTLTVDMGHRGQNIREMVKTGKADLGAGALGDTVKNDPDIRIIHLSRAIPGAGVYLSPELSESDKKVIKRVLFNAPPGLQKQANYGPGSESDYTNFRGIIRRTEEILVCSDFGKNPVNFFCATEAGTVPTTVTHGGNVIRGRVNGWRRPTVDTVWLNLMAEGNQLYRVVVSSQILNQVPGGTNLLELQNKEIKVLGVVPNQISDGILELNIQNSMELEVL